MVWRLCKFSALHKQKTELFQLSCMGLTEIHHGIKQSSSTQTCGNVELQPSTRLALMDSMDLLSQISGHLLSISSPKNQSHLLLEMKGQPLASPATR